MKIDDLLRAPAWTCQWTCPYMGEVNRARKQDLPLGLESPEDLPRHLICHGCKMDLSEIPLIQFVIHPTRPAAIRQTKKFTIHMWPDDPFVAVSDACLYPQPSLSPHVPR
jgi:hypothetical protein